MATTHRDYAVWWSPEDDAYLACAIGAAGTLIHGTTPDEAVRNAMEVVHEWEDVDASRTLSSRDVDAETPPAWTPETIRAVRRSFAVSQAVFADMLNVDLGTVRSWEQGVRTPSGPSARLLEVAAFAPGVFWRSVHPVAI